LILLPGRPATPPVVFTWFRFRHLRDPGSPGVKSLMEF
jgi:hypothetical protein